MADAIRSQLSMSLSAVSRGASFSALSAAAFERTSGVELPDWRDEFACCVHTLHDGAVVLAY
jgi:hypothetical protein